MLAEGPGEMPPGRSEPGGGRDAQRHIRAPHGQPHHPRSTGLHLPGFHHRSGAASALGGSGRRPCRISRHDDQGGGHRAQGSGDEPFSRSRRCCGRRQVRAAGVETDRRPAEDSATWNPCKDASALGTAAPTRAAAAHGGTGRIGLSSSSASRLEMPQFVHPSAQPVMARKCEGTDARDQDPTETGSADETANSGQNWNSSPAALRWSVAGLLDLNLRSRRAEMVARW